MKTFRFGRFAPIAAMALAVTTFTITTAIPEPADAQSRSRASSPSRSSSFSSRPSRPSYSAPRTPRPSTTPPRRASSPPPTVNRAPAREPSAIRNVPPPTVRAAAPSTANEPRVIRNVPPPTVTKATTPTTTREPTAIRNSSLRPTTARPTIQRAQRPPTYRTSNGTYRPYSAPPRHDRYRDTYYGSRSYRYGDRDYQPIYGSGPGMGDVLLWMVVADALSDNGERRINCEYPANASDQRVCDNARRDAARQVGAPVQQAQAPRQQSNPWGWILGILAVIGLGGAAVWFFLRR